MCQWSQPLKVLTGQNFSGGHQDTLPSSFNGLQQGHETHQGFPRSYISLQQAIHPARACHIGTNLLNRSSLCAGGPVWELRHDFTLQLAVAHCGAPRFNPRLTAGDGFCQLMGQKLVIGQAFTCWSMS